MNAGYYEGVIENGRIHVLGDVELPEQATVTIVIHEGSDRPVVHIYSPRLAHQEDAARFELEVVEEPPNARV